MSDLIPDRTGGQQLKGRTGVTQLQVADANAQLDYDDPRFAVAGQAQPGSLSFDQSAQSTDTKHGTTAVVVERHMSERSSGFKIEINDSTRLIKWLQNMSSLAPEFVQATQNFTQSTMKIGSRADEVSLVSAASLTSGDKVWAVWDAGTIYERMEERYVASVVGNTVKFQRPFSETPEPTTLLRRAVDTLFIEGGADYREWSANLKTTGDDSSVHALLFANAVVNNGAQKAATNTQIRGAQLQFSANASEYTISATGEKVPKFSEEHDIPRTVALGLNA